MEEEQPVPPKIPQFPAVGIGFISGLEGFFEGGCFGGFSRDTDVIEMDGVIELILQGNHHDRVGRNLFLDRNIDTQKKSDYET